MKNKKIAIAVIIALAIVSAMYCLTTVYNHIHKLSKNNVPRKSDVTNSTQDLTTETGEEMETGFGNILYLLNEPVESENLCYVIQGYSVEKELPEGSIVEADQNWKGYEKETLLDGYSYVVLNETIENIGDNAIEFALNNTYLCRASDETYKELVDYEEPFTCINGKKAGKDQFIEILEPGEKKEYSIVYIINDKEWNHTYMYIEINNTGTINLPDLTRKVVLNKEDF